MRNDREIIDVTETSQSEYQNPKPWWKKRLIVILLCILFFPLILKLLSFVSFIAAVFIVILLLPIFGFFLSFALIPILIILLLGGAILGMRSCEFPFESRKEAIDEEYRRKYTDSDIV